MSKAYLLPCSSCGAKIPVEASRAGQLVTCQCGASLEVPTLRGLAALEVADPTAAAGSRRTWGLRQRLYFIGVLLFLGGVAGGTYIGLTTHRFNVAVENFRSGESYDAISPAESWHVWQHLRQGLQRKDQMEERFTIYRSELRNWLYAAIGLAAAGLIVAGSGLLIPSPRQPVGNTR